CGRRRSVAPCPCAGGRFHPTVFRGSPTGCDRFPAVRATIGGKDGVPARKGVPPPCTPPAFPHCTPPDPRNHIRGIPASEALPQGCPGLVSVRYIRQCHTSFR